MPRLSTSYGPLSDDGSWVFGWKDPAEVALGEQQGWRFLPHVQAHFDAPKPTKPRTRPVPPPEFRRHFDRLVLPIAARRIRVVGAFVALGSMTYLEALHDVLAMLRQRGGGYLPHQEWNVLEDRVATAILQRIDEVDQFAEAAHLAAARDPSAFWRDIWRVAA